MKVGYTESDMEEYNTDSVEDAAIYFAEENHETADCGWNNDFELYVKDDNDHIFLLKMSTEFIADYTVDDKKDLTFLEDEERVGSLSIIGKSLNEIFIENSEVFFFFDDGSIYVMKSKQTYRDITALVKATGNIEHLIKSKITSIVDIRREESCKDSKMFMVNKISTDNGSICLEWTGYGRDYLYTTVPLYKITLIDWVKKEVR